MASDRTLRLNTTDGSTGAAREGRQGNAAFADKRAAGTMQRRLSGLADASPAVTSQLALAARMQGAPVTQRKTITVNKAPPTTTVNWKEGTLKGSSNPVGMSMEATDLHAGNVDQGELIGTSPLASAQKDLMGKLPTAPKNRSIDKFIKGHLLNHNIGGPGLDYNMFPITASANSLHHSQVERDIKKWVNKDKHTVDYSVSVSVNADNSQASAKSGHVNAVFDCKAKDKNSGDTKAVQIVSEYQTKATAVSGVFNGTKVADASNDDRDYPDGSFLGQVYKLVENENDQNKIDEHISHEAAKLVDVLEKEFDGNNREKPATRIVIEAFNTRGARFTDRQKEILWDIIIDVMNAFVARNDKSNQDELTSDYPTLVTKLKSTSV